MRPTYSSILCDGIFSQKLDSQSFRIVSNMGHFNTHRGVYTKWPVQCVSERLFDSTHIPALHESIFDSFERQFKFKFPYKDAIADDVRFENRSTVDFLQKLLIKWSEMDMRRREILSEFESHSIFRWLLLY